MTTPRQVPPGRTRVVNSGPRPPTRGPARPGYGRIASILCDNALASAVIMHLSSTSTPAHLARPARPATAWSLPAVAILGVLLALARAAGGGRVMGLTAPDGALNEDEGRLQMAAEGILRTGLPVLPSGR